MGNAMLMEYDTTYERDGAVTVCWVMNELKD